MILRDFLNSNRLIENTYDIFNYDTLAARLNVRYGNQLVRCDLSASEIVDVAQNTVDINQEYFRAIFSNVINPYETWGENNTHSDTGTENRTNNSTGATTNAHSGTITSADTGTITTNSTAENTTSGMAHSDNPTTTTTKNNVNAYNASTAVPRDNSDTTSTDISDSNYNDTTSNTTNSTETRNTTNTQTLNNTDTINTTNNGTEQTTRENSGKYNKHGYNINDYVAATRAYYAAYDIIIDFIARDVLITVPDWGC